MDDDLNGRELYPGSELLQERDAALARVAELEAVAEAARDHLAWVENIKRHDALLAALAALDALDAAPTGVTTRGES